MRINKNDKLKLKKPMGYLTSVGEVFEVIEVDEYNAYISCDINGIMQIAGFTFDEADIYFEKVIEDQYKTIEDDYNIGDKLKVIKGFGKLKCDTEYDVVDINEIHTGFMTNDTTKLYKLERMESNGKELVCTSKAFIDEHFEKLSKKAENNTEECCLTKTMNNRVTKENVDHILNKSMIESFVIYDKCIVVTCKLPNGFIIVEHSACVDPKNFDENYGYNNCLKKIKNKIYELEGYVLQNSLSTNTRISSKNEHYFSANTTCWD